MDSNIGIMQAANDSDQEIDDIIADLEEWLDRLRKRKKNMNHSRHVHKEEPMVEGDGRTVFLPGWG